MYKAIPRSGEYIERSERLVVSFIGYIVVNVKGMDSTTHDRYSVRA